MGLHKQIKEYSESIESGNNQNAINNLKFPLKLSEMIKASDSTTEIITIIATVNRLYKESCARCFATGEWSKHLIKKDSVLMLRAGFILRMRKLWKLPELKVQDHTTELKLKELMQKRFEALRQEMINANGRHRLYEIAEKERVLFSDSWQEYACTGHKDISLLYMDWEQHTNLEALVKNLSSTRMSHAVEKL